MRNPDRFVAERQWAKHHGIENPSEELLAWVNRSNRIKLAVVAPLLIAFAVTWFMHYYIAAAIVVALIVGFYAGLHVPSTYIPPPTADANHKADLEE